MATHIIFDGGRHPSREVVPLALASIVLATRRRQLGSRRAARLQTVPH